MKQWFQILVGRQNISAPSDAQSISMFANTTASATQARVYLPISCTVYKVRFQCRVWWTLWDATNSTVVINKNWSSVWTITTVVDNSGEHFTATLTTPIAMTANTDYFNIQWTCPTRPTTNPTNVMVIWSIRAML